MNYNIKNIPKIYWEKQNHQLTLYECFDQNIHKEFEINKNFINNIFHEQLTRGGLDLTLEYQNYDQIFDWDLLD